MARVVLPWGPGQEPKLWDTPGVSMKIPNHSDSAAPLGLGEIGYDDLGSKLPSYSQISLWENAGGMLLTEDIKK